MARERRFIVPELRKPRVELSGDEAHHLVHVLRLGVGDGVTLFDGRGHAASATIAGITNDVVELEVGDLLPSNESPLELTLAVAVPKGDAMSLVVQKLTELGVAVIQPLLTEHGDISEEAISKRLERWERIALEAAKQCGRSRLPRIESAKTFEAIAQPGSLLLTPGASPLRSDFEIPNPAVLVGPEGGWSETELALAHERSCGIFGLGPRTLRTETAAIAAATLMQWLVGDLR